MKYRALITGATGFVGGYTAEYLHAAGWHVSAIVRSTSRCDLLPPTVRDHVQFYDADQMPLSEIVGAAAPDVVFHLATYYTTVHSPEEIDTLISSNVTFGTKLLDAMAQNSVRNFVYARSSWQHYHGDGYEPVNLYAASKEAFDAMVRFYESAYDLHTIRLTLFDTYGENDRRNKLLAVLPTLAAQGKRLALSGGEQQVDFVHVKDAARAFCLAGEYLAQGRTELCGSYVISSGHTVSLRELVRRYEDLLGVDFPVDWGAKPYRAREVMMPWRGGRILPGWERTYKELM
ncbi:NAD(P)-dependent oxidoreductase [uncultured Selenomonas sp.]|uniref:NAD-dependent epimerase/dehydratase family protein n=1 Tax=uncultured Selenomonas sp. TaxID=159275 RepID=UPI0028DB4F90|nr:NAD(P)-dependent oxidoreductase [uncultured Selenomonas sp.]